MQHKINYIQDVKLKNQAHHQIYAALFSNLGSDKNMF